MNTDSKHWRMSNIALSVLATLVLFLLHFRLGGPVAALDSESSWKEVLTFASMHGLRSGVDITLNYGPLTPFLYPFTTYEHSYFDIFYLVQIGRALIASGLIVLFACCFCRGIERLVFFFAAALLSSAQPGDSTAFLIVLISSVLLSHLVGQGTDRRISLVLCFVQPFLLAAFTFEKFTYGVLLLLSTLILAAEFLASNKKPQAQVLLVGLVTGHFLWWFVAGERLVDLFSFVQMSLASSASYSGAMAYGASAIELRLAGCIFVLLGLTALISLWNNNIKRSFFVALLCGITALLAWKAGFVRHDAHSLKFFAAVPLIPFLLNVPFFGVVRWLALALRGAVVVLACIGYLAAQGTSFAKLVENAIDRPSESFVRLTAPSTIEQGYREKEKEYARDLALPLLTKIIDSSTVDVVTYHQGVVFRNGWNYTPRPVFQSHNAFSPGLQRLNEEFYQSNRAPQFVLLHLDPMDGRLALQADSPTFFALLCSYKPIAAEKRFVLFEKLAKAEVCLPGDIIESVDAGFGDTIALPEATSLTLSTDIELSLFGKLAGLLYRLPEIYLDASTMEGAKYRYRYLPTLVDEEALLVPLVASTEGFIALAAGLEANPVPNEIVFKVEPSSGLHKLFPNEWYYKKVKATFRKRVLPTHPDARVVLEADNVFESAYGTLPIVSFSHPVHPDLQGQSPVLMVHPFGQIRAWAQRGDCSLKFKYGLLDKAFSQSNPDPSDGALFTVLLKTFAGIDTVFRHVVTPQMSNATGGFDGQASVGLPVQGGVLVFETEQGAHKSSTNMSDWTYWGGLNLDCR